MGKMKLNASVVECCHFEVIIVGGACEMIRIRLCGALNGY